MSCCGESAVGSCCRDIAFTLRNSGNNACRVDGCNLFVVRCPCNSLNRCVFGRDNGNKRERRADIDGFICGKFDSRHGNRLFKADIVQPDGILVPVNGRILGIAENESEVACLCHDIGLFRPIVYAVHCVRCNHGTVHGEREFVVGRFRAGFNVVFQNRARRNTCSQRYRGGCPADGLVCCLCADTLINCDSLHGIFCSAVGKAECSARNIQCVVKLGSNGAGFCKAAKRNDCHQQGHKQCDGFAKCFHVGLSFGCR